MGLTGEWLEKALLDLAGKIETGLQLDADVVSGLVSYCELAPPEDAREYLINIIGEEASQDVVQEYMHRRGYVDSSTNLSRLPSSEGKAYIKPPSEGGSGCGTKRQSKAPKEWIASSAHITKTPSEHSDVQPVPKRNNGSSGNPKKKRTGKVISLAEASKGSVVFKQGKPCSCQARCHNLVSNCLSCGKIVCEQEGEGPCSFCGALVLREGSTYAGLEGTVVTLSDAEANAEAFAKRLVEYDRNSAARTTVIDDQSDYYEIEGNSWLSKEEKDILSQKLKEKEEEEERRKKKVVMTFDLIGRKVLVNEDEASQLDSEHRILRPLDNREVHRIQPNPTARLQPVFIDTSSTSKLEKGKQKTKLSKGLCLEITGRVQQYSSELQGITAHGPIAGAAASDKTCWERPSVGNTGDGQDDSYECSVDYH